MILSILNLHCSGRIVSNFNLILLIRTTLISLLFRPKQWRIVCLFCCKLFVKMKRNQKKKKVSDLIGYMYVNVCYFVVVVLSLNNLIFNVFELFFILFFIFWMNFDLISELIYLTHCTQEFKRKVIDFPVTWFGCRGATL